MQKKSKKSYVIPVALSALVVALMGTFVLSGTLAKFTSTVSASASNVPAAKFLFNKEYNASTNTFDEITWSLDDLGSTDTEHAYSQKIFYPGSSGEFSMDVKFESDVPATAKATVAAVKKGAFRDQVVYDPTPGDSSSGDENTKVRDLVPAKFLISKHKITDQATLTADFGEIGKANPAYSGEDVVGCTLEEFPATLEAQLKGLFGENGSFDPSALPDGVNATLHIYWEWPFEGNDVNDTLFGQYVATIRGTADFYVADSGEEADASIAVRGEENSGDEHFNQMNIKGEESKYGLDITMTVEQDAIPVASTGSGN